MNPRLHAILLELEYKFDIEVEEYFDLTDDQKAELTKLLVDYYIPELDRNPLFIYELKRAFRLKLREGEVKQEFEKCDICKRVLEVLDDWTF